MAEICMSPFNGSNIYDLKMGIEMEVQIFNASLALYKAHHRIRTVSVRSQNTGGRPSAQNPAQNESSV